MVAGEVVAGGEKSGWCAKLRSAGIRVTRWSEVVPALGEVVADGERARG